MISPSPSSRSERKVGESNPKPRYRGDCLARSFLSQFGYLPLPVDPPGIEPGLPACRAGVLPLDHEPSNPQRSVRESNPTFVLTKDACCHSTYRPNASSVIPDRIEPSLSWMSARCLRRWTTGSASTVTEVGVEPTDMRLSTSPLCLFAYPVLSKWRVRGSHPAVQAYEAQMSTGPPASCRSRNRTGRSGL